MAACDSHLRKGGKANDLVDPTWRDGQGNVGPPMIKEERPSIQPAMSHAVRPPNHTEGRGRRGPSHAMPKEEEGETILPPLRNDHDGHACAGYGSLASLTKWDGHPAAPLVPRG